MNKVMKKTTPLLLILFGLFFLIFLNKPIPAGVLLLFGIVDAIEQIWPEKWKTKVDN